MSTSRMQKMGENNHETEGHFYKGLFYGLVLGVGLVWFLGTEKGKKVKEEFFARGENLLEKAESALEEKLIEDSEKPQE